MFLRSPVSSSVNLARPMRQGDGPLANIAVTAITTDSNLTLTAAQIAGGAVQFTGFSAGRNITVPTAEAILAANPGMDIGDSFSLLVSITTAFAGTWVTNTGVTLAGRATTPASSWSWVVVTRTGASTVSWRVL